MTESFDVRTYQSEDKSFIYSTWLNNYKLSSYFAKRIKYPIFFKGHHGVIDHVMSKPETKVFLAVSKEDPHTIFGYFVCEPENNVAHFMFVKEEFQKMGVGRTLFHASDMRLSGLKFTHWTMPIDSLIKKYTEMSYDPYAL